MNKKEVKNILEKVSLDYVIVSSNGESWSCGDSLAGAMEECYYLDCNEHEDVTIETYLVDADGNRKKIDEYCYR